MVLSDGHILTRGCIADPFVFVNLLFIFLLVLRNFTRAWRAISLSATLSDFLVGFRAARQIMVTASAENLFIRCENLPFLVSFFRLEVFLWISSLCFPFRILSYGCIGSWWAGRPGRTA